MGNMKRRKFLKSVGSTAVGLAALPVAIKSGQFQPEPEPELEEEIPRHESASPCGDPEHETIVSQATFEPICKQCTFDLVQRDIVSKRYIREVLGINV
jgi:hypothetical protein